MTEQYKAKINEIFDSIQGEGPYIGYRQLFVRFCGCNLLCDYCDTEFNQGDMYSVSELLNKVKSFDLEHIHSVSLTGGEPLLQYEFLKDFLPEIKKTGAKIYLETNGTHAGSLSKIIDYVDIISMDIKLKSATGLQFSLITFDEFLSVAKQKEVFAKIVFDENISEYEIIEAATLAKKHSILLILQPKMPMSTALNLDEIFEKFYSKYKNIRLIPQVHKFLNVR